jgi:hypothetical protein
MDDYPHFGGTCCFHLQKRNKLSINIGYVIYWEWVRTSALKRAAF